ncbi:hypothetical protein OMCYN_01660 [cyanobiont of Ornithocercus magnificus]|nr:hypothetical protein OMCYN_01660 [cyanobiont of Ornithocercus magnificus]
MTSSSKDPFYGSQGPPAPLTEIDIHQDFRLAKMRYEAEHLPKEDLIELLYHTVRHNMVADNNLTALLKRVFFLEDKLTQLYSEKHLLRRALKYDK